MSKFLKYFLWQDRKDSNLQPLVLETITLPIELQPYAPSPVVKIADKGGKKPGPDLNRRQVRAYNPSSSSQLSYPAMTAPKGL